jgi:periodic tryptophan protein 1
MSMITATAWVPRGFAAPFPTRYTFDEEEFSRIAELAKLQLDDANEDLDEARNASKVNGTADMNEEEGSDEEVPAKTLKSKAYVLAKVAPPHPLTFPGMKTMILQNMTWNTMMTT